MPGDLFGRRAGRHGGRSAAGAAANRFLDVGRNDPPVHTAERRLANQAFTRQRVNALRPWLEQYIGGLVGQLPANQDVDVCCPNRSGDFCITSDPADDSAANRRC